MIDTSALREKVLDLAIRGKLVPQDPNDEPASVLLERIRAEKEQMVKDGKLKAKDIKNDTIIFKGEDNLHYEKFSDGTVKCIEDEIPFDVPDGWAWCRLEVFCPYGDCEKVDTKNIEDDEWILDLEDIEKETGKIINYVSKAERNSVSTKHKFYQGQLLYSKLRPYLNKVVIAHQNGYCTSEILPLTFYGNISSRYMQLFLMSNTFLSYVNMISYGVKMPRLGTEDGKRALIALPPIKEQERITNKYDSLKPTIANLQTNCNDIQATIAAIKSKILDLAIRGKLVPQNQDDEPASVLLERIKAEKEELIKQGKIKRDKKKSVIFKGEDNSYYEKIGSEIKDITDEIPFDIPDSWSWCRGYSCFAGMNSTKPTGDSFRYIDIDSIDNKIQKIRNAKTVPTNKAPSRASRDVEDGSVLFSFVRPYLKNIAYVSKEYSDCIASTGFYVCNSNGALDGEFMYYLMISDYVVKGLNQFMKGDNSPSITKDNIEDWLYPIPPLIEQKEICKKISALYAEIREIEKSLN